MPISPQIIAAKRTENTVTKICDLIDKKLQESEETPFIFNFLPNTSPEVMNAIVEIYRNVGWIASVSQGTLTIRSRHDEDKITEEKKQTKEINTEKEPECKNSITETLSALSAAQIQVTLECQSLSRKLLMVDKLNDKELPRYEYGEHGSPIYYASDNIIKPYTHECVEDYVEFTATGDIKKDDIEKRRYYVVDRLQCNLKDSIQKQEERAIIDLLQASVKENQIIQTYSETIDRAILDSIGFIESENMCVAKILMHQKTHRKFKYLSCIKDQITSASQRDALMFSVYGNLFDMDMHVTRDLSENEIFILPPGIFLGAFPLPENHIEVIMNEKDGDTNYVAKSKCFPVILNPELVRKINIIW